MGNSRVDGDLFVAGNLNSRTMTIPEGSVQNTNIASGASIDATKSIQQYQRVYAQNKTANASANDEVVHVAYGSTGTIKAIEASVDSLCQGADATIEVDLQKNDNTNSLLTSKITIDATSVTTPYSLESAAISTDAISDGDALRIVVSTSGSDTIGKGLFVNLVLNEDPQ